MMETKRKNDLDWIRILVFGLLILYHIGMFFVPWGWHIKNNETFNSFEVPMMFVNQWRLHLLFVISGMGTYFALSNKTFLSFFVERHNRLLIPLVFGMICIVAPQVYIERSVSGATHDSFLGFYPHYFEGAYPNGNFSWHHLWFLPYLFVYSLILSPVFIYIRNNPECLFMQWIKRLFKTPLRLLFLLIPLLIPELILKPYFPVTHNLVNDWYTFTLYFILFFYGFVFISIGDIFEQIIQEVKMKSLLIGFITFSAFIVFTYSGNHTLFEKAIYSFITVLNMGVWIIAILGFGSTYLNTSRNRTLKYLNQAVYPLYILHQTIIVLIAYFIYDKDFNVGIKFAILVIATMGSSFLIFEIVKRFWLTRILFGIKKIK